MDSIPRVRCASGNVLKAASTAVYLSFMTISVFDFNFDQRLSNTYIFWVHNRSNMPMFCLKKIIYQPWVVQMSQCLEEMILTHYTLMSVIFRSHLTPPICLKITKCAIFSTFRESHLKHTHKVVVLREKFNI